MSKKRFSFSIRLRSNWICLDCISLCHSLYSATTVFALHIPPFKATVNADDIIMVHSGFGFSLTVNTDSARTVCVRVCACN